MKSGLVSASHGWEQGRIGEGRIIRESWPEWNSLLAETLNNERKTMSEKECGTKDADEDRRRFLF